MPKQPPRNLFDSSELPLSLLPILRVIAATEQSRRSTKESFPLASHIDAKI